MRAMASSLLTSLKSHPFITASSVLLLFALPISHMLIFFWPLIVSTVLGVLAVASFGWHSDEHVTPTASCDAAESAWQLDGVASSSHEEKISNELTVGDREVTWLEWLHHEDTQKLCVHEHEPAVWDADGFDSISMLSETSDVTSSFRATANASACKYNVLDNPSLQVMDKGRQCAYSSRGEYGQMPVNAFGLTEEDATAAMLPSTPLDGIEGTDMAMAWDNRNALEDLNKEEAETDLSVLTAEDKTNLHSRGKNHVCQTNSDLTVGGGSNMHAPICAEGNKSEGSGGGLCLVGGRGNECKTMQCSAMHAKDEVTGDVSAGDDNVGILECTNKCDVIAESLASITDIKSMLNTCISEGKPSLSSAASKPGEGCVHTQLEVPSVIEAISHTLEAKFTHTCEQEVVPDSPCLNENISLLSEKKGDDVHEMHGTDEQDEEDRGSSQVRPQWDESDGEEDRSSLRFSFFHNTSLTPSGV